MAKTMPKDDSIEALTKKKKQELIDTTNELKGELTSLISDQVEFQVQKRMRCEEKKLVRGKNRKIIFRDIIILLLLAIIIYFAYCLYQVDYFKLRTKVITTTQSNEVVTINHDKDYYISKYGYLVKKLQVTDEGVWELYTTSSNNLSNALMLKIAFHNLDKEKLTNNNVITFTSNKLNDVARNIFGDNIVINNETFNYNNTYLIYNNNMYIGYLQDEIKSNLVYDISNAYEKDDNIIFEVIIGKNDDNVLKDINGNVINDNYDGNLTNYSNKLDKYKYVFKKENNRYIYDSVIKIGI